MPLVEPLVRSQTDVKAPGWLSGLVEDRFHQPPHVVSVRAGDAVVLMDQKRGTYFTLNEVGGRVWELVGAGSTTYEIVERLLEEYEVPRTQLDHDVATTLRHLIDDRLLERGVGSDPTSVKRETKRPRATTISAGALQIPSVLRCGLLIAWFKWLLRVRGFMGTIEWIRHRTEALPATSETELETVKVVEHAVAMAGALYPGRAKCLEQSLTLYYLLRRHGVAAVYCHGVQPYPFQAHAWIEYRGEVVNDVPEHVGLFSRFSDQLP